MSKPQKVAIAGAGIAGLASAIALARQGIDVSVFEQAGKIEEVGAGLQVGPNAAAALEMIGAWDAVEPATLAPQCVVLRDGRTGRTLTRMPLGGEFEARFGKPYRVAHRAGLLNALLDVAKCHANIEIHTDARATGVSDVETTPALTFNTREPEAAGLVIGADGLNSALRNQLAPHIKVRDAGHTIFRTLLPLDQSPSSTDPDIVTLWLCPGGHVVDYALPGNVLNIVAIHESPAAAVDWNTMAAGSDVMACFSGCCDDLKVLLQAVPDWRKWAGRDLAATDARLSGHVTLVGDAAHATLPYLAQGAAMAIEDAAMLAQHVCSDAPDLPQSLRHFEAERRPRTSRIIEDSRRSGHKYHLDGPMALARNLVLQALPENALYGRLSWVYQWPQFSDRR